MRCSGARSAASRRGRSLRGIPLSMPEVSSPPTGSSMTGSSRSGARDSSPRSPTSRPTCRPPSAATVGALSMICPADAAPSAATTWEAPGPVTISSWWDSPTRNRFSGPVWIPTDIRRFTFAPGSSIRPTVRNVERISSAGGAGPQQVVLVVEEQQHRVAAELQELAALLRRDAEERVEARVDRLGDVLGALASAAGQALGQLGEAGDVDEDGGSLDDPVVGGGGTHQPSEDGARQERLHGARFGRAHRHSGRGYLADGDVRNQPRSRADEGGIKEATDEAEGEPEVDDRDRRGSAEPDASERGK